MIACMEMRLRPPPQLCLAPQLKCWRFQHLRSSKHLFRSVWHVFGTSQTETS
jgi:hypothetical protein